MSVKQLGNYWTARFLILVEQRLFSWSPCKTASYTGEGDTVDLPSGRKNRPDPWVAQSLVSSDEVYNAWTSVHEWSFISVFTYASELKVIPLLKVTASTSPRVSREKLSPWFFCRRRRSEFLLTRRISIVCIHLRFQCSVRVTTVRLFSIIMFLILSTLASVSTVGCVYTANRECLHTHPSLRLFMASG